jgi:hypothetical protein
MRMPVDGIEAFVQIAELGSFQKAAEKLPITGSDHSIDVSHRRRARVLAVSDAPDRGSDARAGAPPDHISPIHWRRDSRHIAIRSFQAAASGPCPVRQKKSPATVFRYSNAQGVVTELGCA